LWQVLTGNTAPGRYRAFIVAYDTNVLQTASAGTLPQVRDILNTEDQPLPPSIRDMRGGRYHHLKTFIYEYSRPSTGSAARLVENGLLASVHMSKSGLSASLGAICGA
jgi:hypothetical protein